MRIVTALLCGALLWPAASWGARQSPVDSGVVTSGKGWRLDPFGSGRIVYHSGYDISVPVGTPVHPTQSGTVFFAGPFRGYGNLVAIDHGNGYITYYGHNSQLLVKPGDRVDQDSVIALSGNTGRSTGPHVHYEMKRLAGYDKQPAAPPGTTTTNLAAAKDAAQTGATGGMGGDDESARLPEGDGE